MNDSTWTWMSGSNVTNQLGVYGTKGVDSVDNVPGARYKSVGWLISSARQIWLLGGIGFATTNGTTRHTPFIPYSASHTAVLYSESRSSK